MAEEVTDFSQVENQLPEEERWENLTMANDFIFSKAMRDPGVCREVLEVLLGRKVRAVSYPEAQKVIDIAADSKSVRLDVYLYGEDAAYDVEMQTTSNRNLPKRSRYYSSMIDLGAMEKGADYSELPKSFVIFICTFDPFGKEHRRYTFRNVCEELSSLSLDDGVTKMFFNTKGIKGKISVAAENFLKFVESSEVRDDFTERLKRKVDSIKKSKEWRMEYMTLMMRDREKYNEGRAQERAEWEAKEAAWNNERADFTRRESSWNNERAALQNENLQLLKIIEELKKSNKS